MKGAQQLKILLEIHQGSPTLPGSARPRSSAFDTVFGSPLMPSSNGADHFAVNLLKRGMNPLMSAVADIATKRAAAKYLLDACVSSASARAMLYQSEQLRPLWDMAHKMAAEGTWLAVGEGQPVQRDWVVTLATQRAMDVLMRHNVSAKYWLVGMLDEQDSLVTEGAFWR